MGVKWVKMFRNISAEAGALFIIGQLDHVVTTFLQMEPTFIMIMCTQILLRCKVSFNIEWHKKPFLPGARDYKVQC